MFGKKSSTVRATDDVSFSIKKGEFLAIAGPSGSGKTTLLNLVGGLDASDAGSIVVYGNAFDQMSQSRLADLRLHKIGFVFQAYNLIPVLSAAENVEFVMLLQGVRAHERQQRAKTILDDVGLAGKYDRRPAELSGGQQQRVAIARALATEPEILLLDEVTSALDPERVNEVLDTIRALTDEGITMIIVSHEMSFVREVSTRVAMMDEGRIIEYGTPEQIFVTPEEQRTRDFVSKILKH